MRTKLMFVFLIVILAAVIAIPIAAQQGTRADQGLAFLKANNIPPEAFRDLSVAGRDPQAIAAVLTKYGYTGEQVQQFLTPQNVLTLSAVVNPGFSNDVVGQAMGLLAPYNLTMADLDALLPVINDPMAMMKVLAQKGLSAEDAQKLLQQAAPLIQEAGAGGMLQYAMLTETLQKSLETAGFSMNLLYEASGVLKDPEALAAFLKEKGFNDQQIQNFQGVASSLAAQGVTGDVLDGWTVKNTLYRLEGLGLPTQSINEILALGNLDAVRDYLAEKGYSGDALALALVNIEGVMGPNGEVMNSEKLEAFQSREAVNLLEKAGIDPADMGDILAAKNDPEALKELLAGYGLDDKVAADFMAGLEQSTFAKTVDPENTEAFVTDVENAANEISSEGGDEQAVGDEQGGNDNQSGEEQQGGEIQQGNDNQSGEEQQGNDNQSGGEQQQGGEQSSGDSGG